MKKENYFFVILTFLPILFLLLLNLVSVYAAENQDQNLVNPLSINQNQYFVNDEIEINVNLEQTIYSSYELLISSSSKQYKYKGDFNEIMFFYPTVEDIYTAALVEKATGAIYYQIEFVVLDSKDDSHLPDLTTGNLENQKPVLQEKPLDQNSLENTEQSIYAGIELKSILYLERPVYYDSELVKLIFNKALCSVECQTALDGSTLYYSNGVSSEPYLGDLTSVQFIPKGQGLQELYFIDRYGMVFYSLKFNVLKELKPIADSKGLIRRSLYNADLKDSLRLKKSDGLDSNAIIEVSNSDGSVADINEFENSPNGKEYTVDVVPFEGYVDSIKLRGVKKIAGQATELRLEQIPLSSTRIKGFFSLKSFAIDPTSINFSNGTVTSTAVGTELWKCKDWNFTLQTCFGTWQKIMDLSPGQQYSFEIDSLDPGFSETSPSTGTPDAGNSINIANVDYTSGTFASTQSNDGTFFAAGQNNGGGANLDPVGFLNLTYNLTLNLSDPRQIYNMSTNISYCHSADITAPTTCSALLSGVTVETAYAQIFDFNLNSYVNLGVVGIRSGVEGITQYNVSPNFANYLNSQNQTNIRFGYNITITTNGRDATLAIDYAPLTVSFDRIYPFINFTGPSDNDGIFTSRNYTHINVSANDTLLRNITIFVYNSTGDLINSSNISTTTLIVQSLFFNLTDLADGLYFFNATACDMVDNCNDTQTRNITVDVTLPNIIFNDNSEISGIYVSRNSTVINITITDANLNYSTAYLYNSTGSIFNTTNSSESTWQINYTDLPDGLYFFNVSAKDLANNSNVSETRNLTLDTINPHIIFNPRTATNGGLFLADFFVVNISILDTNFNYSIINVYNSAGELVNSTNSTLSIFEFNFTAMPNGVFFYNVTAYDLALNINYSFTRNITLDTGAPHFVFNAPTPADGSFVSATFVEVNVSIVDPLAYNLSVDFYNSTGARIANATTNTSIHLFINETGLINGIYFYNASGCDLFGNCNNSETRNVTIFFDNTYPSISYNVSSELSGSIITRDSILINVSASDSNFRNLTIYLYNSSFEIVNMTNTSLTRLFVNYSELPEGLYFFNASACDLVENCNTTQTRNVTIDLNIPHIYFDDSTTDVSEQLVWRNYTMINVSVQDLTFKNLSISIFNSTGALVVIQNSIENNLFLNATDLADGLYFFNATACDFRDACNSTQTRNITFDTIYPQINYEPPTEIDGFVSIRDYLTINVSVVETNLINLSLYVYDSLDSLIYSNSTTGDILFANITSLAPGSYYYNASACDLTGKCTFGQTKSYILDATPLYDSAFQNTREGMFAYGIGTDWNPRYRFWNGTGFTPEQNASSIGDTVERIRLAHSTARYEYALLTTDFGDDINIQLYSYLPNGTLCWNDGSVCGSNVEVETLSTSINRLKGDVAYEHSSGDALVVFSDNTAVPKYVTWNGTGWSSEDNVPQTYLGGVVSYVKMASKAYSDEIALIMTNTTRINIMIWNGTGWGCEPSSLIPSPLTPDVYQHADLAYERVSGDLFVALGLDVTTEIGYVTKDDGSCIYNVAQTAGLAEEGEHVSIAAQPGSDFILLGQYDAGAGDLHAITWNGTDMLAISGNDGNLYATDTSPRELFDVAWAGTSSRGLLIYSDIAASLNVDYFLYNITNNAWYGGTVGLNPLGITAFSDEEEQILTYSFIEENRTFLFVKDEADLLWAKYYDANSDSWTDADGGTTLGSPAASVNFKSFDFTWMKSGIAPIINYVDYTEGNGSHINRTYLMINVSANDSNFLYSSIWLFNSTFDLINFNQSTNNLFEIIYQNLPDGVYYFNASACDVLGNCNTAELRTVTIDNTLPVVLYNESTDSNGSYLARNNTIINVTAFEINLRNLTILVYNSTFNLVASANTTLAELYLNQSDLIDGLYFFNATACDFAGNCNTSFTRNVTIDTILPVVNFTTNTENDGTVVNKNYFTINASANDTNLKNISILIYNSTFDIVNISNLEVSPIFANLLVNFTNMTDGFYYYIASACDLAGNCNSSFTKNITINTGAPYFYYNSPTPSDGGFVSTLFVEINVSIIDPLYANLSIFFYNSTGYLLASNFTNQSDSIFINVTSLVPGIYFYNASGCNLFGNCNISETRNVTIFIDVVFPTIQYTNPTEVSSSLLERNYLIVNVTANDSNLKNLTIFLYNSTFNLVNESSTVLTILFTNFTNLSDGTYFFNATACDFVENCNHTQTRNVTIDLFAPYLYYEEDTTDFSGVFITRNFTNINVSAIDASLRNLSIRVFNSVGILIRNLTSDQNNLFFNATDLLDGLYYINASACDFTSKCNFSLTRNITIDATFPQIDFVAPTDPDGSLSIKDNLEINVSVFDLYHSNFSLFVYNSTGDLIYSDNTTGLLIYANISIGYGIYYYNATACDLAGNCAQTSTRSFTRIRVPLFDPMAQNTREGLFAYGLGAVQNPYYRFWNGTGFGIQQNASSVGGTIERIRVAHSTSRYEYALLTTDTADDANIQFYSVLPNGTLCWNNGSVCSSTIELTSTAGAINRLKADIAYEYDSGDALVVYVNSTATPLYRTWNGTEWSQQQSVPQSHLGGIVSYVKMASRLDGDEIALIMTNTTRINILIWNGTGWDCEPPSLLSTVLTPDVYQHADLAYERLSGDLFVAVGLDVTSEVGYITKNSGTCNFIVDQTTALVEEGEYVAVAADHSSDSILIGQFDAGANDLHAIAWDGNNMLSISGNDADLYVTDTSPRELFDVAWAGLSGQGLLIYSDIAASLNVDYFLYNASNDAWLGGTTGLNPAGITDFSDEEEQILTYSFIEENRTFLFVKDELDALWAKYYDANTGAWVDADGGVTLGSPAASANFKSFDFTWKKSPQLPIISFISPTPDNSSHINQSSFSVNVTANDTNYNYMIVYLYNSTNNLLQFNQSIENQIEIQYTNLADGIYYVNATACDVLENCESTETRMITVDTSYPSIQFNVSTDLSGSYLARNYTHINVSTTELNLNNLTIFVYNSTGQLINISNTSNSVLFLNLSLVREGIYFFNATACDYAGNCNSTPTRNITIDLFAPQINFTIPTYQNGTIVNESWIVINASANDTNHANMTISIYNSTGLFARNFTTQNNLTWNRTLGNQGYYYFNATACDLSGRCINTSTRIIYTDFFIPSVSFALPTEGNNSYTNRTIIFINATASDFSFKNLTIRVYNSTNDLINFSNTTNTNLLINLSDLVEGIYFFNATACDFVDKCNSTSTRRVTIDLTNPNITFANPTDLSDSILNRSYIIINLTTFDNYGVANITLYLYNATGSLINTTFNSSSSLYFNISNLSDGLYFFNASTTDFAGNTNWTETRNLTIGSQGPIITLNYPQNNSYLNVSIINFNYSVFDAAYSIANCTLYIDGIFNETNMTIIEYENQYFFNKNLTQGWHNWSVSCENTNAVLTSSANYSFYIDSISPIVTLISPIDLEVINPQDINMTYMINASVIDASNVSVFYEYRFNSTDSWQNICNNSNGPPYNCTWNLQNLIYGLNYQVRAYAIDIAGNQGPFDSSTDIFLNASLFVNITSVFVDDDLLTPINQIDLTAGSRKTINCNISATDALNYNEINLNVTFRSMSVGQNSFEDNRTYYINNSCTRTYGFDRDAEYICGFNVIYYAINETWVCDVTAWNNYTITNRSDNTTMNQLFALNISTESMDYSVLPAGQTSQDINVNVTNIGNVPMNLSVFGYGGDDEASGLNLSYLCDINNISVSFHKFSTTVLPYDSKTNLSSTPQSVGLTIPPQTNESDPRHNSTYWQLQVPGASYAFGNCNGSVVFMATPSY